VNESWTTNASPRITLSANDAGSGVGAITYTLDGGSAQSYSGPFVITGNGPHAVSYRATDNAGNQEAVRTATCASPPLSRPA